MTGYIAVRTKRPAEIKAYLYATASLVGPESTDEFGNKVLVVAVDGTTSVAEYQRDRISSGMHGATLHETPGKLAEFAAEENLPELVTFAKELQNEQ